MGITLHDLTITTAIVSLLYSTLLYSTLLYSTLLYSTLLYSTLLYSTLLYSTPLYSTAPSPAHLCSCLCCAGDPMGPTWTRGRHTRPLRCALLCEGQYCLRGGASRAALLTALPAILRPLLLLIHLLSPPPYPPPFSTSFHLIFLQVLPATHPRCAWCSPTVLLLSGVDKAVVLCSSTHARCAGCRARHFAAHSR